MIAAESRHVWLVWRDGRMERIKLTYLTPEVRRIVADWDGPGGFRQERFTMRCWRIWIDGKPEDRVFYLETRK